MKTGRFLAFGKRGESGSETDVSTSNENLSSEERYVIRHTRRVEPQGQEVQGQVQSSSNRSSLDSYNTLIIHNDDNWRLSMNKERRNYIDVASYHVSENGVQEINEIPDDYLSQSSVLKHLAKEVTQSPTSRSPSMPPMTPPTPSRDRSSPAVSSNSPRQASLQGAVSKTVGSVKNRGRLNKEKLSLSHSQPDLSSVGIRPLPGGSETSWLESSEVDDIGYSDMLDILVQENAQLKNQLDETYQKISKSQKLEEEVTKVHRAYEELVGSCERRERLERAARGRLQADCRRLHDVNRALKDQVELLSGQVIRPIETMTPTSDILRKELQNREMLITQLITQNKELICAKERQEIEIAAQRATLQEQRTHIDILDTALTNAQSNVVRLEEECRHAQGYIERVAQLQKALASLQHASDRREQTERKLRSQLEKELQNQRSRDGSLGPGTGGASESELRRKLREKEERVLALEGECAKWEQRYLEESALRQAAIDAASIPKDAKIAALEKTSQETERLMAEARNEKIRHMDELHDAQKKCADLEGRLKELESKVAERDAMIKVLQKHTQSQYVSDGSDSHYNTHSHTHSLRNNSSREELVGFGASSSAASFSSQDTVPMYHHSVLSHLPSSSNSHSSMVPKYGSTSNSLNKNATDPTSFEGKKRTLDDQLAKLDSQLDSQLLSKRGLCCFPAFTGAGAGGGGSSTAPRRKPGKLPKPLEASSAGGGYLGRQEVVLLEKQGLASQRQRIIIDEDDIDKEAARRSGSLPPSSLPRPPPRKPPASSLRRFGDYSAVVVADAKKATVGYARSRNVGGGGHNNTSSSRESLLAKGGGGSARDSAGSTTMSDDNNSASSSLPPPSKLQAMYARSNAKLGASRSINKYRIQF